MLDKRSIFIDKKATIGKNVIIYENNRIEGPCIIDDNVTIFPNNFISNSKIGKGSKIYCSVIDRSKISACCSVGPFSYIVCSNIDSHTKVRAFSEIKKNKITKEQ